MVGSHLLLGRLLWPRTTNTPIEQQPVLHSHHLSHLQTIDAKAFHICHRESRVHQFRAGSERRLGAVTWNQLHIASRIQLHHPKLTLAIGVCFNGRTRLNCQVAAAKKESLCTQIYWQHPTYFFMWLVMVDKNSWSLPRLTVGAWPLSS